MSGKLQSPICETSEQPAPNKDQVLRIQIRDLLFPAYKHYEESFKDGDIKHSMYWDGYIRALHHVQELQGQ